MKKRFRFFFLGFFSHGASKYGAKCGYVSVFLSLVLSLLFIWSGFFGAYMIPFGAQYKSSDDFRASAYAVFANGDLDKRIDAKIENGSLKAKMHGGEYEDTLLINTLENEDDKQNYSVNGYAIVLDLRNADTLAEVEAYCVSNDGKGTVISYEDYLTLSDVARLNFDFKLKYTGNALELTDEATEKYCAYLNSQDGEARTEYEKASSDLTDGKITKDEYNRKIYELYFEAYFPKITEYESASNVPLLRNYYSHQYINNGIKDYLFIFDDCMVGSFKGIFKNDVSFYGFYSGIENGAILESDAGGAKAYKSVDTFIKGAFRANWGLNAYACFTSTVMLTPLLALMVMVAALLTYSILKLKGVKSVPSLGAMLKIIGSFIWFSGAIALVFSVICAFFVKHSLINALPPVAFFLSLLIRSIIFAVYENKLYLKESAEKAEQTEA